MQKSSLQALARLGYIAHGLVYVVLGGLAIMAAIGRRGPSPDSKGALITLLSQPFGSVLLGGGIAVGLVCFAVWRFAQAVLDADGLGRSFKSLVRRSARFVGGCLALGIAASAARLAFGLSGSARGGDSAARDWTASLLALPAGRWLVGAVGVAVVGAGVGMAVRAWTHNFERALVLDANSRVWVRPLGALGFASRAIVFALIGAFLVSAAWHVNSGESQGLAGALHAIQDQAHGWILLSVTGLGLVAFGGYEIVAARYRRIAIPNVRSAAETLQTTSRDRATATGIGTQRSNS